MQDIVGRLRGAGCVFAEDEARLLSEAASTPEELERLVAKRVAGEPIEYLVGWARFAGLRLVIEAGVFVPRHRSEFLVELAAQFARSAAVVLDLCCGCGALGAAVSARVADVELYASDVDPAAVRCARRNGVRSAFEGDLFAPLPAALGGRVDVLLANAPYVPTDAIRLMPHEAREHEARAALDGGADGTDAQRRIISASPRWLAPGGRLLTETSGDQAPLLVTAMSAAGLTPSVFESDEWDATVAVGLRPA